MDIISFAYSLNGLIIASAYVPQILKLLKDSSGAEGVSISSWMIFNGCSIITLLYSLHLGDPPFIITSFICALGNSSVVALTALRRMQQPVRASVHISA